MNFTLKDEWTQGRFPPGAWPYVDARTGMKFDPNAGDLNDRVKDVQKHRRANPNIFPEQEWLDSGFIRQQIVNFVCSKRPELCVESDAILKTKSSLGSTVQTVSCPQCGKADAAKPTYCVSCGGNRISFWTCECGQKF